MNDKKYYKIITFGCQMNRSDSERVSAVLEHLGYHFCDDVSNCDIVVINACSVRQPGIDRIWGYIRNFDVLNEKKKKLTTVLTGCLLEKDKKKLSERVDLTFNIKNLSELEEFLHGERSVGDDYFDVIPNHSSKALASVPIMTGCDNYCSYCAVPYVRGRELSRSIKKVLNEIKKLAQDGYVEIILLGQNVNSYKPDDLESFNKMNPFKHSFAKLLWEVNQINGLERISFQSAHPKDMDDEVVEALALPKMLNYVHLALQSADDTVLKNMNRGYTSSEYETIIEKINKVRPGICLGTDIIVGFPGETAEQFENTYNFYKKMNFDICFTAMYSPRNGTVASRMEDDVPRDDKKLRWKRIQEMMEKITYKKNQQYDGQEVSVLVDKIDNGVCEGNSREMKRVRFKGSDLLLGKIVTVKVVKAEMWILEGII